MVTRVGLRPRHVQHGRRPPSLQSRRAASSSLAYDATLAHLRIGSHTRVIFQGFTGKLATVNARESLAWGTRVVGGVKRGAADGQEHLGLPVLPSVRAAVAALRPEASGVYVAAPQAAAAIEEAIEAEVPLIVAVAEHIPLHDMLRIHSILATQSRSRLVGANSPGIISPLGRCRIGFQPLSSFSPGPVGVAAKSGTLSYETVASLTRAGIGQSLCIGMGGDAVAGTDLVDALRVFETDESTEGIVLVGEVGGTAEEEAAEWIREYRRRVPNPKPIAAVVAGLCAVEGEVMGHSGAWRGRGESTAAQKWRALEAAGAVMADHPSQFGSIMKRLLPSQGRAGPSSQKRGLHTSAERSTRHLPLEQSKSLLGEYGIQISTEPPPTSNASVLTVTVHRSKRQPCLIASPPGDTENTVKIPFDYNAGPDQSHTTQVADHTQLPAAELHNLVKKLWTLFREKEGASLSLTLHPDPSTSAVQVSTPRLIFDPAAFATAGRHASLHGSGSGAVAAPLAAHGMAYIALPADGGGLVGTLVNGAGLAMNTVDALAARGVCCANFLDTGGRATAEGVAAALRAILAAADGARPVRAVFVNAFGGLTRCDMVARGVLDAVREEGIAVPLVVRLRGTNEAEGQRLVAESGLGTVFAYDGFDEAAAKLRQLLDESEGGR